MATNKDLTTSKIGSVCELVGELVLVVVGTDVGNIGEAVGASVLEAVGTSVGLCVIGEAVGTPVFEAVGTGVDWIGCAVGASVDGGSVGLEV